MACPRCGCEAESPAHALVALLIADDVDAALDAGLLDVAVCRACNEACRAAFVAAQVQRRFALSARDRFRAREARLARRAAQRDAARATRAMPASGADIAPR